MKLLFLSITCMHAQFQQSYLSIQPVSVYYIIQSYQHLF
jgi:hypothetical protein